MSFRHGMGCLMAVLAVGCEARTLIAPSPPPPAPTTAPSPVPLIGARADARDALAPPCCMVIDGIPYYGKCSG